MTHPQRADVLVIDGGIVGTSVAPYLTYMGVGSMVLLERKYLAAGFWASVWSGLPAEEGAGYANW